VPPVDTADLVERLWARDATLWTGRDESRWLGWLDEPARMLERVDELEEFATSVWEDGFTAAVLLGMGGSSLAPEVLRRWHSGGRLQVLDTTHPTAVRRLADTLEPERTLFVAASKSGTTLETRSHLDFFWEWAGRRPSSFVAITDPGSELENLAAERGFRATFAGEPTIGGRYSALSVFGLVPGALAGTDLAALLGRAEGMVEASRSDESPGLDLGLALGTGWLEGRDKALISPNPGGFGLWAEQLIAESTGKQGKGLIPAPGEERKGPDRQLVRPAISEPADLGAEFYRWEFATAVAATFLEINPFDQPNVQEAKGRTTALLSGHGPGSDPGTGPEGSVEDLLAGAQEGDYIAIQAFIDPAGEPNLDALLERARKTGCVVTKGLGPRYLHSTGQLHKGGPPKGRFIQVVDDPGEELEIPGRPFGFAQLIAAQAAGDYAALEERGRAIVRVRLEEI
jgi:transaldolase / glucose-6-phosphate isomerase